MNDYIASQLEIVRQRIRDAELRYQRPSGSVKLLAVSKGQSVAKIIAAIQAGQNCLGENYVQEALQKMAALSNQNLEWHFIGTIQSNKTKLIAENFSWVHSVCRLKMAERLNAQRSLHLPPLQICIEVNTSDEATKSGIPLAELREFALAVSRFPRLKLRGLMTIPAATDDKNLQHIPYRTLQQAFNELRDVGLSLDTLSMGMSNDLEAAIAEGSTLVRIGTAIFGAR